ncbi:Gfo/Idh/MocA family protein [Halorubrum aethiopicum]|uniref:Gfo/Idh/MocA family protein n=1 Tax=Halorubrum aethiopicum TaxID=1758255 RepID=UPI000831AC07|nr:Gfo/Idh/MocA family oxidoreductase [Halorubrum aethiopicum]
MPVKTAFVGAGGIASVHLSNTEASSLGDIVAVCDIDPAVAESTAETHDVDAFTDVEALFNEAEFDAVIASIPPFAHGEVEKLAVEHETHLFVEKPLGLDRETAETIDAAITESDIITQVGHMNRYADIVERAVELIDDRQIALINGHWYDGVADAEWWRKKARSGGQVVEQSTHVFDLVRYLAGDVEDIHAYGERQVVGDQVDFEDSVVATMYHETGTVSHVATSCASPRYRTAVDVIGDGFDLQLDFNENCLTGIVDGEDVAYEGGDEKYRDELEAFLDAVSNGDRSLVRSPYSDAKKTFETTLDVYESIDTSAPIDTKR